VLFRHTNTIRRQPTRTTRLSTLLLLCMFPILPAMAAQAADDDRTTPLVLPRLSGPITLDGYSDEPAWQAIEPLPLTAFMPIYRGTPTERTEIRVAYDDNYLYVAGRMYDSEPHLIQATTYKRDNIVLKDDKLVIVLDTFNDNENALSFFTTPAGLRTDLAIFNDAASVSSSPFNLSWNTFWDAAVTQNGKGWFAEMRIPFSSLRFQDSNGEVVMGLSCFRVIARKVEIVVFPDRPPKWELMGLWKPSQTQKVRLEGITPRKPVYITPYALGGLDQSAALNQAGTAYETASTPAGDIGLDVKYGLTSNLTLDLTLNTDFAQVEADDQQINLTRFSLYFPEKRLFFQERASIFDFRLGGYDRLFYSRRIGLHEGRIVPIYGGARLVGRVGDWDVGAIDMQTAPLLDEDGQTTLLPSENLGVARLRRQVFNPYSYAGGMLTSRMGTDGTYNYAYGLDAILRLFGDDYLTVKWSQTFDSGQKPSTSVLENAGLRLNWERRTRKGPGYYFSLVRLGADFNPGVGFKQRKSYTRLSGFLSYGWFPGEASKVLSHWIAPVILPYINNETRKLESNQWGVIWRITTKTGSSLELWPSSQYEALQDTFFVSGSDQAYIPPGNYTFYETRADLQTQQGKPFSCNFILNLGSYYDGRRQSVSAEPSWSVSRYMTIGGFAEYNRVRFPTRDQRFDALISRLRLQLTFNTALSLLAFVQTNTATDAVIVNLRLRYNPREGTDLYLVYNDNLNTDRKQLWPEPDLPFSSTRAVLLKYSITFLR